MKKKNRKNRTSHSNGEVILTKHGLISGWSPLSTTRSPCSFNMDNREPSFISCVDSEPEKSQTTIQTTSVVTEVEEKEENNVVKLTIWEEIMQEYENDRASWRFFNLENKPYEPEIPIDTALTAMQYLDQYIFPVLCPALEDTLFRAKEEECLQIQKCVFNGLDHIAEILWNKNPLHPKRIPRNIFSIPFVKLWLREHPRPIYPLSWIWTKEQAITVLQAYIRRYFVCREPNCYEMRKFWQLYRQEKREEQCLREKEHLQEVTTMVNDIMIELIAMGIYKVEGKIRGCVCISKPCHCECKCFKWCKCCRCYKSKKSISTQFYSYGGLKRSVDT